MLQELSIKNFAIISDLQISFDRRLNVLTGETGVGKSIIIDALNLVLGERASSDLIRKGDQTCEVSAIFNINNNEELKRLLKDLISSDFDEQEILLRRQLTREGRNRCFVNANLTNLNILQLIGERLVDVHGQHEHQTLLNYREQLNVLDNFGDSCPLRERVSFLYKQYKSQKEERDKLMASEEQRNRKADLYQFEISEINQANLTPQEEENLEKEYRLLSNAQKLSVLYTGISEKLYEQEGSVFDLLKSVSKDLKAIAQIDCEVEDLLGGMEDTVYQLEGFGEDIRKFNEKINFDPQRLEEVLERKDLIVKLRRKYGNNIEEILSYKEKIEKELEQILSYRESKKEIVKKIEETKQGLFSIANDLSKQRRDAAKVLERNVKNELCDLSMNKVRFFVECREDKINLSGLDSIKFLISPNVGEDLKPLSSIASGGEMSRIMLALKTVLAQADSIPCLIFDEIDAGISGGVARTIGKKLVELSNIHQVICITHLPQIASFASTHFYVTKQVQKGRTKTMVKQLEGSEKVKEIARMLGGENITPLTLQHAEEMIRQAK